MIQSIIIYTIIICTMVTLSRSAAIRCQPSFNCTKCRYGFLPFELIILILTFSIIMGFRYEVGEDYSNYYESYKYGDFLDRFEYLFLLLSYSCYNLQLPVWAYFGILAFLQICFFTLYFKNNIFILPLVFIFLFAEGSYLFWLNGIRQAIALCIWLYAVLYIEKKKWWKYLLLTVIAFGFHKSVVYLILFYPLLKDGNDLFKKDYFQLALLVVAFIVRFTFSDYMKSIESLALFAQESTGMANYVEKLSDDITRESSGTGIAWMFYTFCYILVILYNKKMKQFYKGKRFVIIYTLFYIGFLIGICLPANSVILSRPFRYLFIFQPIIMAYFVYFLQRKSRNEKILSYVILAGYIGAFYLNQITTTKDSHIWFQFL